MFRGMRIPPVRSMAPLLARASAAFAGAMQILIRRGLIGSLGGGCKYTRTPGYSAVLQGVGPWTACCTGVGWPLWKHGDPAQAWQRWHSTVAMARLSRVSAGIYIAE